MIDRLGIVVGLAQEAACARLLVPDTRIGVSGATRDGAERAIARLIEGGARRLLSFGLAGGLDPALRAGALLVPDAVLVEGVALPTDPGLLAWMRASLDGETGLLLHSDALVVDKARKQALRETTDAGALDMESGHVASIAGRHGCGFAVLRVVCDGAGDDLPPAARIPLRPDGTLRPLRIAGSILRHPSQLPELITLGRNAAIARAALRRAMRALRDRHRY